MSIISPLFSKSSLFEFIPTQAQELNDYYWNFQVTFSLSIRITFRHYEHSLMDILKLFWPSRVVTIVCIRACFQLLNCFTGISIHRFWHMIEWPAKQELSTIQIKNYFCQKTISCPSRSFWCTLIYRKAFLIEVQLGIFEN